MARNLLRKAAIALRDKGKEPIGRDPEHQKVRSVAVVLSPEEKFVETCADALRSSPGKVRTSV